MRSIRLSLLALAALLVAFVATANAQDEPAADPAADPAPIEGKVGKATDEAPAPKDPADAVVRHIVEMTEIVRDDIDKPEDVKKNLKAYIDENTEAMKEASEAFEAKLSELPSDERQAYKEKLQRKMEGALADFLEVMLDFSERHPDAAKELDELLQKVQ